MNYKNLLLIMLLAVLPFTSCDSDDDLTPNNVPTTVSAALSQKYPGMQVRDWEREGSLYKAEFYQDGRETEAWFMPDGTWVRTETDCPVSLLPTAVSDYVSLNYAGYWIDDADYVQTPTASYYELELEKNGARDVRICIDENGNLVSA